MVINDNEFRTKENKFKPRIKLNHNIFMLLYFHRPVQYYFQYDYGSLHKLCIHENIVEKQTLQPLTSL